jgi:hypothetical protein
MPGSNDVDITVGVDTGPAAVGLAELRNYGAKVQADLSSSFARAISFVGLTGGLVGIVAKLKELVSYGDKVYELGQRFAVSTTVIQQFGNVAEKSGSSLEGIAMGFNRLDIAASKALGGNQQIIDSFANLGISVEDLKNLSPEEIMLKIGSSSMNAADMVKILGKNGTELRETLRKLADGSEQLGKAMDPGQIAALHRADEAWKTLAETLKIKVGGALADILAKFEKLKSSGFGPAPTDGFTKEESEKLGSVPLSEYMKARAQREKDIAAGKFTQSGEPIKAATPTNQAGSAGGSQDASSLLASGSGSGSSSRESIADKIAKLEEEHAQRAFTDQQKLNALVEKHFALAKDLADAGGDQDAKQQALLDLAENQQAMDKLGMSIIKDQLETESQITAERQKAGDEADQDLAKSRESTKELQLQLKGRDDLAEKAKIEFDYDQKIKDAAAAVATAESQGFTAVANTNRVLVQQLTLEKQTALAAHDKAVAEAAAALAIEDQKQALEQEKNVDAAKQNLDALKEQRVEQDLINAGRTVEAQALHDNFDWQTKINEATDKANTLWQQMLNAYQQGKTLLGDQYAEEAKLAEATANELALRKKISAELAQQALNQKAIQEQTDTFFKAQAAGIRGVGVGGIGTAGATGADAVRARGGSEREAELANARDMVQALSGHNIGFLEQASRDHAVNDAAAKQTREALAKSAADQAKLLAYWKDVADGRWTPAEVSSWPQFAGMQPSLPSAPGSSGQIGQLQTQINLMQAQLSELVQMNSYLRPQPGQHP